MQYTVILLLYFFLFYWHNLLFKNTEIIYNSEALHLLYIILIDIYISFIVENNHYLISAFQESTFQRRITQSFLIEYFLYTYQHINSDIQCINKNKNIWYKQHYHTLLRKCERLTFLWDCQWSYLRLEHTKFLESHNLSLALMQKFNWMWKTHPSLRQARAHSAAMKLAHCKWSEMFCLVLPMSGPLSTLWK